MICNEVIFILYYIFGIALYFYMTIKMFYQITLFDLLIAPIFALAWPGMLLLIWLLKLFDSDKKPIVIWKQSPKDLGASIDEYNRKKIIKGELSE